jgi:hypothetical protein
MFRVIACVALMLSGCAYEAPPTQVVRKTVVNVSCPTDDEFRDMAIAASRDTYFKAPRIYKSGSGACPCREDTYERNGVKLKRGEHSAEAKKKWVLCKKDQVPATLIAEMKATVPSCRS